MASDNTILVIEDDADIAELLKIHLSDIAFDVDLCTDGRDGLNRAANGDYSLIVLDIMLPGIDGLAICKRLRSQSIQTPILMLTAKSSELDRVLGLELGADDYLSKPFSIKELQARVKAILRRVDMSSGSKVNEDDGLISIDQLQIDPVKRRVTIADKNIELTATEYDLLLHFARNPGRVYSRAQLLDQVWGYGHDGYEHTVNSHINRLRKKIERNPHHSEYIQTVWGVGYKLAESVTP